MLGIGEHIKGLNAFKAPAAFLQLEDIALERFGAAGNVYRAVGGGGAQGV